MSLYTRENANNIDKDETLILMNEMIMGQRERQMGGGC